jgi:hypothetical protein
MRCWVLALSLAAAPAWSDDEIVIEGDDADEIVIDDGDSDEIIIVDDGESGEGDEIVIEPSPSDEREVSGALGRLWETWHAEVDSAFLTRVQPLAQEPLRNRGDLHVGARLLPARNLKFFGDAIARGTLDADGAQTRVAGFLDLYEAYAKVNAQVGSVQLGRVVVPWGRTTVAALGDRLNPPDHRRGPNFSDTATSQQPQLGAVVRTSLGGLGVEGVALFLHEPTEGSLSADDQGGVRPGRYQGALIRSADRFPGLSLDDREELIVGQAFFEEMSLGLRVNRRIGDIDLGASAVHGPDPTPTLRLSPEVARYLGRDAFGGPSPGEIELCPEPVCAVGGLLHERTTSFTADAAWGLGIVILKAEVLAQPQTAGLTGKASTLVDRDDGLRSARLPHYGAALAVEGALGEALNGSLEVFDFLWTRVPAGAHLWGVEPLGASIDEQRSVHRVAVGASLAGSFLEQRLEWLLRGESGINQADVLMTARLRYRLPVGNLYVGGQGDLFTGVAGSPGWMRQDASTIGVFLGEGA